MTLTPDMGQGHWPPKDYAPPPQFISDKSAAVRLRDRLALEIAAQVDGGSLPGRDHPLLHAYRWLNAIASGES